MSRRKTLSFAPRALERPAALIWLKRVHAWTGFWGALLFFILGVSGILLNHRSIMEIDTGKPVEVSALELAVPAGTIESADELGAWAKKEFNLASEPREPRGRPAGPKTVSFMGKDRSQPKKWEQQFNHPNGRLTVEYVEGAGTVFVHQNAQNLWGFIKNLHKGSGLGVAWVLFLDTIAGALIAMTITGFLLWSRLHGGRLVALGIIASSIAAALLGIWPFML